MKKKAKPSDYGLYKSLKELSSQLQTEGFSLSPEQLHDLKVQIAQEMSIHKSVKEIKNNTQKIVNYLAEYFDSFILLGYDSKGERIELKFCDTALKQDALMKLLEQIFIKYHRPSTD
jgi:hypothetical protein